MARHITAKKQLTRERALALIDQAIEDRKVVAAECEELGFTADYCRIGILTLEELRKHLVWACDAGVFPPSK